MMCGRDGMSHTHEREKEGEHGADHDDGKDRHHHRGRRTGANRDRAAVRGEPLTAGDHADRQRQKGRLDQPHEEVVGRDRVRRRHHIRAWGHVRQSHRGGEPPDERQPVPDPGEHRHREDEREATRDHQPSDGAELVVTDSVDNLKWG